MYDDSDPRMFVVERHGVLYFNGRTAEERLRDLVGPVETTYGARGRQSKGLVYGGKRAGIWRYSIDGEVRFEVQFDRGEPVDPPAGWIDDEWPSPDFAHYEVDRQLLELLLREYRRPEDIERIYPQMTELSYNSVPIVGAIRRALGLGLSEAKMALDAACTRAKGR